MLDDQVLRAFPPRTHALTLVADPDEVLADPALRAALADRGFRLIDAGDPILLRHAVQQAQPWTADLPLVVVTAGELNTLPYDLWQPGHHVTLSLDELFPGLFYPLVRALSPRRRRQLSEHWAGPPDTRLSLEQTVAYILDALDAGPAALRTPAALLAWLDDYHASADPLPPPLITRLLAGLRRVPAFAAWALDEIVGDGDAYRRWLRGAWSAAVEVREAAGAYRPMSIPFASDAGLQDMVPRLLRSGTLLPLDAAPAGLPAWARPATAHRDERDRLGEFRAGLDELGQWLVRPALGWPDWQAVARLWARLCVLRYDPDVRHPFEQLWRFKEAQAPLDERFFRWLEAGYARLAARRLPGPHHLHHVPEYLARRRGQNLGRRPALLILDGMAFADWLLIREVWQARHPEWHFEESSLLAQVPSITSVSRQALVAGLRPDQFAGSLLTTAQEAAGWSAFWQARDVPSGAAVYAHLPPGVDAPIPDAVYSTRTQALCLVSTVVDDMLHGATQGAADVHGSLRVWLGADDLEQQRSVSFERLIAELLVQGYTVTVTSDHGHVAAEGIGQPQEGVLAHSRSRRARLYGDVAAARVVHEQYPATILWHDDGLLPSGSWGLMPRGRGAFAPSGRTVVSHGGLTIDEMIVPFVTITEH